MHPCWVKVLISFKIKVFGTVVYVDNGKPVSVFQVLKRKGTLIVYFIEILPDMENILLLLRKEI